MKHPKSAAFTFIELLIVVAIIGVLAALVLPIYNSVQLNAARVQSLNRMRQLAAGALAYAGDNSGNLPGQGDASPSWSQTAGTTTTEMNNWYNVIPRSYANSKGLGDYAANPSLYSLYYSKESLFYVPVAKYATNKLSAPLFAIAYNSKLFTGAQTSVVLQLISLPAQTVLFQESGVPGETVIKGQKAYTNQSYSYASRTAARYNGQTVLVFIDGHAGEYAGSEIVDPTTGKAYFAAYPTAFPTGAATVYWETDPTVSPN